MPLIDLLSDPTAFKFESKTRGFGNDMPGNGSSGLPYVQFGIDDDSTTNQFRKYYQTNRMSLDFPIRGGSLTQVLGETAETPTSEIDRVRIQRFLENDPRGNTFLLKQRGLQLSNPRVQTGDAFYKTLEGQIPGLQINTQVFNDGKNMLAQIRAAGTGVHVPRIGNIVNNVSEKYYQDVVGKELTMTPDEVKQNNRLMILANLKLQQATSYQVSQNPVANSVTINKLGISLIRNRLFDYFGGPDSVYGIGKTVIKRAIDTTEAVNYELPSGTPMSDLTYTYSQLMAKTTRSLPQGNTPITNHYDFRDDLAATNKIGFWSDDGQIDIKFFDGRVDKLNKLTQFNLKQGQSPFAQDLIATDSRGNEVNNDNARDIIKFAFECLSNDDIGNTTVVMFRAYLGAISDNNNGTWNAFKYMGRGENFYTYQGFDRTISFSFKIAIGSRSELDSTYEKLNYLISQVYPDYSDLSKFMRGSIIKLTMGDYLYRVPGFLESVNVSIDQGSTWEIDNGSQLPHYADVTISFKPILNQLPQRNKQGLNTTNIIRQIDMPSDSKNNIAGENTNTDQQTETSLNLTTGNVLSGVTSNNLAFSNFGGPLATTAGSTTIQSPATKTAAQVNNKKAAVAKKNTTGKKPTQTGPTVQAAAALKAQQTKVSAFPPGSPFNNISVTPYKF